ncbi:peptide ABC transporter ATPase [Cryobacterium roopkundense]|uniref:Peptide ABC transporter ATPase n=1 Tax=Cryobacterium roopkundense TaxID=1001240 RepID=A0A099JU12_9MICO|nr:ABC transporter ATP-binding protein [Cryobacterium roopkundense]KGJ81107.1 peptide ABC transporter ATPase [Cryobacterium roopkundense]MBB5641900.1 peptide/nickel transport system ATP-binding protein [Cryobacterium roopkundense]
MPDQTAQSAVPVLEMINVGVEFGVERDWVPAAKNLTYSIRRGQILAVVGESGSGKSASSMAILDLLPRNSRVTGSIKLDGQELRGLTAGRMRQVRGEKVAAIFQEPMTALNPVFTIGFQIVETLRVHTGMRPIDARARALELLSMVELPDPEKAYNSYPHQLSGGQRQRAMIAQALSCDPMLLIADEPTTALDVTVQAEILELLRDLRNKLNSAVLLITHDMGVVADLADDIVVMKDGEIVEAGEVHQIFLNPQHEYTKALLAAVPRLGFGFGAADATGAIDVTAALAEALELGPATATERATAPEPVGAGDAVLQMDDIAVEFGKRGKIKAFRAVDGVSLSIRSGEVLGLVGESGSGKTTIGRAAVGLQPIVEGSLIVTGRDITKATRKDLQGLRRRVGIVFQDPSSSLNPRLSIGDSIGEPLKLAGESKGKALGLRIEELLDSVRLPRSYRNRYPHELSGGQKQRVGIARALSLSPLLLVADEPTSALDVSVQATVLELLKELQAEMKFACLFISHDLAVVDIMADRIAVMHYGRIVETGTRDEVLRAPKDPYTQRLIAAIPVPDPDTQRDRRELRLALLAAAEGGADRE